MHFPLVDEDLVRSCAAEVAASPQDGEARLRYGYALAHSRNTADVDLATPVLEQCAREQESKSGRATREVCYLLGVAAFRGEHYSRALEHAEAALRVAPTCSQSAALKRAAEDAIKGLAEDGLLAISVGAGVLAVCIALAAGAMSSHKGRR